MLNLYPDSLGANLSEAAAFLQQDGVSGAFSALYVLPSLFHTDLDRGFSVIDYGIEQSLATKADLDAIRASGVSLKLDFVLNHASVQSPQFQDMIARGDDSPYRDFFIDWNAFWQGKGEMTQEGYLQPEQALIADMFFRKPGLPILMVRFPDGTERPYWNTFYQEIRYPRLAASDWTERLALPFAEAEALGVADTAPDAVGLGVADAVALGDADDDGALAVGVAAEDLVPDVALPVLDVVRLVAAGFEVDRRSAPDLAGGLEAHRRDHPDARVVATELVHRKASAA